MNRPRIGGHSPWSVQPSFIDSQPIPSRESPCSDPGVKIITGDKLACFRGASLNPRPNALGAERRDALPYLPPPSSEALPFLPFGNPPLQPHSPPASLPAHLCPSTSTPVDSSNNGSCTTSPDFGVGRVQPTPAALGPPPTLATRVRATAGHTLHTWPCIAVPGDEGCAGESRAQRCDGWW